MIDFGSFYHRIASSPFSHWLEILPSLLSQWSRGERHAHFLRWQRIVENLPCVHPDQKNLNLAAITVENPLLNADQRRSVENLLRQLMPWRKGPFSLYGVDIDTEWRSDWKWERLLPHISPLIGRRVLDVGCGSGYHLWRMKGADAEFVLGVDPMELFFCQFEAVRKLLGGDQDVHFLPIGIEQLPSSQAFDTVFSMGVLYHRRSPIDHLYQLKNQLVSGGELILETLIIEGNEQTILLPQSRYARMSNVWFIPSASALMLWLEKCGFTSIRCVDCGFTTPKEQRRTDWMQRESLAESLDPNDSTLTIEGYPAPKRAIFLARKC